MLRLPLLFEEKQHEKAVLPARPWPKLKILTRDKSLKLMVQGVLDK